MEEIEMVVEMVVLATTVVVVVVVVVVVSLSKLLGAFSNMCDCDLVTRRRAREPLR